MQTAKMGTCLTFKALRVLERIFYQFCREAAQAGV